MFKTLHQYWLNYTNKPSVVFKLNLWTYIQAQIFNLKVTNILTYCITSLSGLKTKKIKIFHKNFNFEGFFNEYLLVFLFVLIVYLIF